jgi:hypothetical protein
MGALEDMTNLIPVVVAGGVLTKFTSMLGPQTQASAPVARPVASRRRVAPRPIAPRSGRLVKKLQGTEAEKYYKVQRLGYSKAKALGVTNPVMFRNTWNGDFSNIGF